MLAILRNVSHRNCRIAVVYKQSICERCKPSSLSGFTDNEDTTRVLGNRLQQIKTVLHRERYYTGEVGNLPNGSNTLEFPAYWLFHFPKYRGFLTASRWWLLNLLAVAGSGSAIQWHANAIYLYARRAHKG